MEEIKNYLKQLGMKITDEFAQELTNFKYKSFKKGEFYVAEGKIAKHIAFIKKGKIRHFYNIDGKEYTRWVSLGHNFVTAFTSFVRQVPSVETLECIEPCELFLLGRDTFYQIKNKYPEMQQLWTLALENEMIGYEDRVFQLITTDSENAI